MKEIIVILRVVLFHRYLLINDKLFSCLMLYF